LCKPKLGNARAPRNQLTVEHLTSLESLAVDTDLRTELRSSSITTRAILFVHELRDADASPPSRVRIDGALVHAYACGVRPRSGASHPDFQSNRTRGWTASTATGRTRRRGRRQVVSPRARETRPAVPCTRVIGGGRPVSCDATPRSVASAVSSPRRPEDRDGAPPLSRTGGGVSFIRWAGKERISPALSFRVTGTARRRGAYDSRMSD
jgi:hypothetical protein